MIGNALPCLYFHVRQLRTQFVKIKVGCWRWKGNKSRKLPEDCSAASVHQIFGTSRHFNSMSSKLFEIEGISQLNLVSCVAERKTIVQSDHRWREACLQTNWGSCGHHGAFKVDLCAQHIKKPVCWAEEERPFPALQFPRRRRSHSSREIGCPQWPSSGKHVHRDESFVQNSLSTHAVWSDGFYPNSLILCRLYGPIVATTAQQKRTSWISLVS